MRCAWAILVLVSISACHVDRGDPPGRDSEQEARSAMPHPTDTVAPPMDTVAPSPEELRDLYYNQSMGRLTQMGDSLLGTEASLPLALFRVDGRRRAYLFGMPPASDSLRLAGVAADTVVLVKDGRCSEQAIPLHRLISEEGHEHAGAANNESSHEGEDDDAFLPAFTVEGQTGLAYHEESLAVRAGACPRVIGMPEKLSRDSIRTLVWGHFLEHLLPPLEEERGTKLEARLLGGGGWTFRNAAQQLWFTVALKPTGARWDDQMTLVGMSQRSDSSWGLVYRSSAPMPDPAVSARWTALPVAAVDLDGDDRPEVLAQGSYPSSRRGAFDALVIYKDQNDGMFSLWKSIPFRPIRH